MNKYLGYEIFDVILKLTDEDVKAFVLHAQRRKRADNKEHAYLKLFRLYHKQAQNDSVFDEKNLNVKAAKLTDSIGDLNQDLHNELLTFLVTAYRKRQEDANEAKINYLIDLASALAEKQLYSAALDRMKEAISLLKIENPSIYRHKTLYLTMKAVALLFDYKLAKNIRSKDKKVFTDFQEYSETFIQMAHNMHSLFIAHDKTQLNRFKTHLFPDTSFYHLLLLYMNYKQEYDVILKQSNQRYSFSTFLPDRIQQSGNESIDKSRGALDKKLIHTGHTLIGLEKIFAALMLGDEWELDTAINDLMNKVFHENDVHFFNPHLAAFVYRWVFEAQIILAANSKTTPDVYKLRKLHEITFENLRMFSDAEISGFALRVELNTLILLFLQDNYREILQRIEKWDNEVKLNRFAEYYPDVLLLEIICRWEQGGVYDEIIEKCINYYESFGKKNKERVSTFHRKSVGFIRKFRDTTSKSERRDVVNSYQKKLDAVKNDFKPVHHLLLRWMRSHG